MTHLSPEHLRLEEERQRSHNWKRWGPYLPDRQWGTVREDYSEKGEAWQHFDFSQADRRAYRWGEDGLLGFCDRQCRLCLAPSLWNGKDPILKERLFGLTGPQGNHGEDVKELYLHLDATPTHSYNRSLYLYPQKEYPYKELVAENLKRSQLDPEYEIGDTDLWDGERYFEVQIEMAKAGPDDLCLVYTVTNRGDLPAELDLLANLWFRNTWAWACEHEGCTPRPSIVQGDDGLTLNHSSLPPLAFQAAPDNQGFVDWIFTENETNRLDLYGTDDGSPFSKDAFQRFVVQGHTDAVNPDRRGTKAAALYHLNLDAGQRTSLRFRLTPDLNAKDPFKDFDGLVQARRDEADQFYQKIIPTSLLPQEAMVQRRAYAGLLFTKQFYHYSIPDWLRGDQKEEGPSPERGKGRNADWKHFFARDIISMPDKWEYPWFASWDLAFHTIPFAAIDPDFAKDQLLLMLREWYMHPNGQIPAYEWNFGDVNPPVHAWACWRVYKLTGPKGGRDRTFLKRCFNKLLINFTWWVNRKDLEGRHLFTGGFLGLDNISVFDRSHPLPTGGHLEQADGTAWMAFFASNMLAMALELAEEDAAYADVASKFFEHFVAIADAMNAFDNDGLWNEEEGFYVDRIKIGEDSIPLRLRSMVGLIPLFTVLVLEEDVLEKAPDFRKRLDWYLNHRRDLAQHITYMESSEKGRRLLLAIPKKERLKRVLQRIFDEEGFLSPHGVRSLSKHHQRHPFKFNLDGNPFTVRYLPGESDNLMFGGNSNWRGPIWMPLNFLLVEALQRYHYFYGEELRIEVPTGSGRWMNGADAAAELEKRLSSLFLFNDEGKRPCYGEDTRYQQGGPWQDHLHFHEYFDGDNGRGLGASHQTGWTALVAKLLRDLGGHRTSQS